MGAFAQVLEEEKIKKMSPIAESQKVGMHIGQPLEPSVKLKQDGNSPIVLILTIISVLTIGVLGFFFLQETKARKQAVSMYEVAEQARMKLEQTVAKLTSEVEKQKEEIMRLMVDLEGAVKKAAEVDALRTQHLEEMTQLRKMYGGQIDAFKRSVQERDQSISSLQASLKSLKGMMDSKNVTAGVVAIGSAQASVAPLATHRGPVSGKVLMVNELHHFVIVNLGPAQGAQIGQSVQISQNGKILGSARIDRVYENLSAATIMSDDTLSRVRKGDEVFLTLG